MFIAGWWFQIFFFSISYMGCHPKPIDELHDFSRWLLHHQPNIWGMGLSEIWIYRQLPFQEGQWGWSKDLLGHLWGTLFQMNPSDKDGGFFSHISSQKASKSEKKTMAFHAETPWLPDFPSQPCWLSGTSPFATKHVDPNRPWRWRHLPCDFQVRIDGCEGSAWWSMPLQQLFGDGSIPTILFLGGMNLHLPPILMLGDFDVRWPWVTMASMFASAPPPP